MPAVKQRCHRQLDDGGVRVDQTERKRQRRGVVGVLDGKLGFKKTSGTHKRRKQTPAQCQQHAGNDGKPKLTVHRHSFNPQTNTSFKPLGLRTFQQVFPP